MDYTIDRSPILFYVDASAASNGDGRLCTPFKSISAAIEASRRDEYKELSKQIVLRKGIYRENVSLDERDNGLKITSYENEDARIFGSRRLIPKDFVPYEGDVWVCDLNKVGISLDEIGPIYHTGNYGSEKKYDDYKAGLNIDLYFSGERMKLASYPAEGYLRLYDVRDVGEFQEYPVHNANPEWDNMRNPRAGEYVMDAETNERVKGWKKLNDIWAFAYWGYDWADSSTPVRLNTSTSSIFPRYTSRFGAYKNALYKFINVFDELKHEGQYYIDRDELKLYIIPIGDMDTADIELALNAKPLIKLSGCENVTIENLSLSYARANAIEIDGRSNSMSNLKINGISGEGVCVNGCDNIISSCEINDIGCGGIILEGGDRYTLTSGGNRAYNNLIHNIGKTYPTYHPGVELRGVGNICSHNEICDCPHSAILYKGNEHIIEYNKISRAVTHSTDAGAIYAGRDWTAFGCVIRYNYLFDIGAEGFRPDGIYLDDCLSGQTVYGNVVINARKNGLLIGGGRHNTIYNNIIADCGIGVKLDDRGRDAWVNDGWGKNLFYLRSATIWQLFYEFELKNGVWAQKYPELSALEGHDGNTDSVNFPPNPVGNRLFNNIIINPKEMALNIFESVPEFSEIGNNPVYTVDDAMALAERFCYNPPIEGFERIPIDKMGRET